MSEAAVTKRAMSAPMVQTMQSLMPHVPALLPPDISPEQFRAALYLELTGRPALAECTQESLRDCVIKAATYGLLPGRDVHFLPFANKRKGGKKEATYIPNYFGLILALERTGKIRRAFAHPVHEGDVFQFDMFLDRPVHQPAITLGRKPGKELFYYGAVMFKEGTCAFEVLSLEDLDEIRKRAPAHESGPWVTDRVMMCRKSAIKRVAKYVRLTPEQRQMLEEDAERERLDIPEARHQQNIVDLFGEGSTPTAAQQVRAFQVTPTGTHVLQDEGQGDSTPIDMPGRATQRSPQEGQAWDVLRAHQANPLLPEGFLERIAAALSPLAPATEMEAQHLAGSVLDWLDHAETAEEGA